MTAPTSGLFGFLAPLANAATFPCSLVRITTRLSYSPTGAVESTMPVTVISFKFLAPAAGNDTQAACLNSSLCRIIFLSVQRDDHRIPLLTDPLFTARLIPVSPVSVQLHLISHLLS